MKNPVPSPGNNALANLKPSQPSQPYGRDFRMFVPSQDRDRYEHFAYKPFMADFLARILVSADVFVDVGAHCGYFSMLACSLHPKLRVLSIEPAPDTCTLLRRSIALLGASNIDVHQVAASHVAGQAKLVISPAPGESHLHFHPDAPVFPAIDIETRTIDSLLQNLEPGATVVKICAQGSELAVLEGMSETFRRVQNLKLIVEFNPQLQIAAGHSPDALLEHLGGLGYVVHLLDEDARQFYRLRRNDDWRSLIGTPSANLYCVRSTDALSVCFFSHSPGLVGAERILLELVDDLVADHGAVCTVVLPAPGPLLTLLEQAGAACIVGFPYGWWCSDSDQVFPENVRHRLIVDYEKGLSAALMPVLRRLDPDVLWTQTMVIPWGAVCAAQLGKPHVWYVTEFGEKDFGFNFFSPFPAVIRDIVNSSDHVFVCSRIVAQTVFPAKYQDKVQVIYFHVPMPAPSMLEDREQRRFFRIPDAIKLGIFGQVRESKGQEEVVRAVAKLSLRGRNVELLIAGGGLPEEMERISTLIRALGIGERVNLAGFIDKPFPAMQACDILIVASRMEAFGRVGVEAMLLSKPVVFAAAGGLSEYMVDGQTGLSYSPGNADSLASQLERLVVDPRERRMMGDHGHARAMDIFTKDSFSGEVCRVLRQVRVRGRGANGMPGTVEKILKAAAALPAREQFAHVGRNDLCPCGSGRKFKRCHGSLS